MIVFPYTDMCATVQVGAILGFCPKANADTWRSLVGMLFRIQLFFRVKVGDCKTQAKPPGSTLHTDPVFLFSLALLPLFGSEQVAVPVLSGAFK